MCVCAKEKSRKSSTSIHLSSRQVEALNAGDFFSSAYGDNGGRWGPPVSKMLRILPAQVSTFRWARLQIGPLSLKSPIDGSFWPVFNELKF